MRKIYNYTNPKLLLIFLSLLFAVSFLLIGIDSAIAVEEFAQNRLADCGEKSIYIETYERISYISMVAGFGFIFLLTFLNDKIFKIGASVLSAITFSTWGYIYFAVDYDEIRRSIFNYNVEAETALNNIAEGQDRYKSEQGVYLDDLEKLHSHIAGASGLTRCVKILEIKVYPDYWTAAAQQVSSPDKVYWDSRKGSSLKKG